MLLLRLGLAHSLNTERAFHTTQEARIYTSTRAPHVAVVPELLVLREDAAIFDAALLQLSECARRIVGDQMPNSSTAGTRIHMKASTALVCLARVTRVRVSLFPYKCARVLCRADISLLQ